MTSPYAKGQGTSRANTERRTCGSARHAKGDLRKAQREWPEHRNIFGQWPRTHQKPIKSRGAEGIDGHPGRDHLLSRGANVLPYEQAKESLNRSLIEGFENLDGFSKVNDRLTETDQ
jgi:hypothetical protein